MAATSWTVADTSAGVSLLSSTLNAIANWKGQYQQAVNAAATDKLKTQSALASVTQLDMQRAQMYVQTSSALHQVQEQKAVQQGSVAAANAATGTIGSSANAVMKDADVKASTATAKLYENANLQNAQISAQAESILTGAASSLTGDKLQPVSGYATTMGSIFVGAAGAYMQASGASKASLETSTPGTENYSNTESNSSYLRRGYSLENIS